MADIMKYRSNSIENYAHVQKGFVSSKERCLQKNGWNMIQSPWVFFLHWQWSLLGEKSVEECNNSQIVMFSYNSFLSNFMIWRMLSQCIGCGLLVCCLVGLFFCFFFHLTPVGEVLYHAFAQLIFEAVNCQLLPHLLLSTFRDQPCLCEESPAFV